VDKSATGSVNFFGPDQAASRRSSRISAVLHLRPPAIDHGVTSFLWGLFFGLLIWLGGGMIGYSSAITFVLGAVVGFLAFVFVRVYGEDEPRRP
jgi:hypothetical protein